MDKMGKIKEICQRLGIRPSKRKGQNFLINPRILDLLIRTADLKKSDTILEIGPGFGILTQELTKKAKKVVAIEIDKKLANFLKEKFKNYRNIEIIQGDILKIENWQLKIENYKLVANLPYSITGPVLRKFLASEQPIFSANWRIPVIHHSFERASPKAGRCPSKFPKPKLMVLVLQKEVAERVVEKNQKRSIISLMVNFYGKPEIIRYISKNNFWPRPKVDSALLRIALPTNYEFKRIRNNINEQRFFQLIRQGFSHPRKQLINNLKKTIEKSKLEKILKQLRIEPKTRAEDLSLKDWLNLYQNIYIFVKNS